MFLYEGGFLMARLLRRSWAPRGPTPLLLQRGAHHQFDIIVQPMMS